MGSNLKIRVAAFDKASKVIKKVSENLRKAGKEAEKANRKFSKMSARLKHIGKSAQRMGRGFRQTGKNMTRNLTLPIAAVGGGILRMAFNFQKSMNKVGAVTRTAINGKVTPRFKQLEKLAKDLGATTEFSASQVAEAMANLGRAGFSPDEIEAATDSVLALATATGVSLDFAADIAAKSIRAFGLDASEAGRVADVFAKAAANSNVSLETIGETMKFVAPVAKSYGASIEEATAFTGLLGDVGIQGSQAGTTLKNMFVKLINPSDKAKAILKEMTVPLKDGAGNMRKLSAVFKDLAPALAKLPQGTRLAAINELFGLRAISGASAMISKLNSEGKDPIKKFVESLKDAKGTAKGMQATMQMGLVKAINNFNSAMEGAAIKIAESGLIEFFTEVVEKFTSWFREIRNTSPELLNLGLKIAGVLAVAGPLIVVFGTMVSTLGTLILVYIKLKGAIAAGTVTMGFFNLSLIPVLAGLGALALMAGVIITNWDRFGKAWDKIVNDPIGTTKKLLSDVINLWDNTKASFSTEEKKKSRSAIIEQIKRQNGGVLPAGLQAEMTQEEIGAQKIKAQADNKNYVQRKKDPKMMVHFKNAPPGTFVETRNGDGMDIGFLNGPLGFE